MWLEQPVLIKVSLVPFKKQSEIALSSCETEHIAGRYAASQGLWLESLLAELRIEVLQHVLLIIDNKSAINLAKNSVSHGKRKHIETTFHFLRDQVMKWMLKLVYCPIAVQTAKIMTKALRAYRFEELRRKFGIVSVKHLN